MSLNNYLQGFLGKERQFHFFNKLKERLILLGYECSEKCQALKLFKSDIPAELTAKICSYTRNFAAALCRLVANSLNF